MRLETAGIFSEPVIFVRQEVLRVMIMPRIAFAASIVRLGLLARVAEPLGGIVSTRAFAV